MSTQFMLAKSTDPVYLALAKWNSELVLSGSAAGSEEPLDDGRGYTVEGSPKPLSRPRLKVARRPDVFYPGPDVRFEQRDDGLHLVAVFEEDRANRVAGTLPFPVQVKSVQLAYGDTANDVLDFPEHLPEPGDPETGPAFKIEADAIVPAERKAEIIAALLTRDKTTWNVNLEFKWTRIVSGPQPLPPHPIVTRPIMFKPALLSPAMLRIAGDSPAVATKTVAMTERTALLRAILVAPTTPSPPQPRREEKTYSIPRPMKAYYPNPANAISKENSPIYAAVDDNYMQVEWMQFGNLQEQSWFRPTPIQGTVYVLPDGYRLQVNEVTGQPSIEAILLRKNSSGELVDTLDPSQYKVRLTLKVRPTFNPERLNNLRAHIRGLTTNQVKYAEFVLGGYSAARFVPDPSLAGVGELFAGSTAGERDMINPAEPFTLTYEGNAEFIDMLFKKLRPDGEGINGSVVLDLVGPGKTTVKQSVPVLLSLGKLAPVQLPWSFTPPPAPAPGTTPEPDDLLPRELKLTNASRVDVTLGGLTAYALQESPVTRRVDAYYSAKSDVTWPRTLPPGSSQVVHLTIEGENPLCNAWDIALVDCQTKTSADLVVNQIFDAATSGVRGWKVDIDCPPFAFFDQLSPEDKAKMADVVAFEVEVRRFGSDLVEEARLTRQTPSGAVLLSRTVADFISDRAVGRSTFEYRQRTVHITRADDWTPWRQESGKNMSVFLT
jgi:hypothetical protein